VDQSSRNKPLIAKPALPKGLGDRARLLFRIFFAVAAFTCGAFFGKAQTNGSRGDISSLPCRATGVSEIVIGCTYAPASREACKYQISLRKARITFNAKGESEMHVDLSFQNLARSTFVENRPVYIEFDDNDGRNYIRRQLRTVDFRKLAPGRTKGFSNAFLAPALQPGRYLVKLWIPSSDLALRSESSHSLLLCNSASSDSTIGLNRIAEILVR
jgi:hypothetical protein